jgi:hypothetical protein
MKKLDLSYYLLMSLGCGISIGKNIMLLGTEHDSHAKGSIFFFIAVLIVQLVIIGLRYKRGYYKESE